MIKDVVWKEIEGSDGWKVSTDGRFKNPDGEFKIPKQCNGYQRISFNGTREWVHRIVAKTFIPNPFNKPQVDHKNGNRSDNRVSNLRWCTSKENSMYAAKSGAFKNGNRSREIIGINVTSGEERYFSSQSEAERELGIRNAEINKTLRGERKSTHGWKFFYLDEYKKDIDMDNYRQWAYGKDNRQLSLFDFDIIKEGDITSPSYTDELNITR